MAKSKIEKIASIEEQIAQLENQRNSYNNSRKSKNARIGQNAFVGVWGFWKGKERTACTGNRNCLAR